MSKVGGIFAMGILLSGTAIAFHEQGVANCNGCHVVHEEPLGGRGAFGITGDDALLLAESPSDVCLSCHAEENGSVLGSNMLAPPPEQGAGNFVFLREDNLNDGEGGVLSPIPGDAAGHNLVAPGHGLSADTRHSNSPGGTFPSNQLGCTSCHDPHGNQNYRMLYGIATVQNGVTTFLFPAPQAEGIDLDTGVESQTSHVAYRSGMSDWCSNCHGRYHDQGPRPVDPQALLFEHESGIPVGGIVSDRYNRYQGDDDPEGGSFSTAYLPEVPFEDPATTTASTQGTSASNVVMCLSCHRAHASSSPFAGRWDLRVAYLAEDGVLSGSYPIPNPYFGQAQGPLCGKCHTPAGTSQPDGMTLDPLN